MMNMGTRKVVLWGLLATFASACSGEMGAGDGSDSSAALKRGSKGPEVRALYDYLKTYGYFENPDLRAQYPGWQPIVSTVPVNPEVFDASLEEGLLEYQKLMGLEETGEVDEATQRMIDMPRCGHPDFDPDRVDPSRKFALYGGSQVWNHTNITYSIGTGTGDITNEWDQVRSAMQVWSTFSGLTFTQPSSGHVDIAMYFRNMGAGTLLAQASPPDNSEGTSVRFNDSQDWRNLNLVYVAAHELGHALGLAHSSVPGALMYAGYDGTSPVPSPLPTDDRMAIGALYSSWENWPGAALDISHPIDGNTDTWVIGADGNVWRWNGSGYGPIAMGAVPANSARRIAAATATQAAVLTTSNDVYELVNGTWTSRSASGRRCVDLTYRSDASSTPVLYCAGTDGKGYRFINGGWTAINGLGSVVRIASGPLYNHPEDGNDVTWAVLSDGSVMHRRSSSWVSVPKPKLANGSDGTVKDIGVGIDGSVWIVGGDTVAGGSAIYIWNEQASSGSTTPVRKQWLKVPGGAANITVDRWGRPWITANDATIWRRR